MGKAGQSLERVESEVFPFPLSVVSDIAECQTEEGEAKSEIDRFHGALVQLRMVEVLKLLE